MNDLQTTRAGCAQSVSRYALFTLTACTLLSGCLAPEDPALGPGGFAGNLDGSTTTPGGKGGACQQHSDCSDGEACTVDRCVEGLCKHQDGEGKACEDGDKCTTGESCQSGACSGGKPVPCDDGSACTADQCNPASGACVYPTIEGPCDDGNPCTTGDHCAAGKCATAGEKNCSDSNPCTADSCTPTPVDNRPAGSCIHVPINGACVDGSTCTEKGNCKDGNCVGTTKSCEDGNPCTTDTCDPKTGCTHAAKSGACDDANKCTTADQCNKDGDCAGKPVSKSHCDDGNPCTNDKCSAQKGCSHIYNGAPCDDGNTCTKDDKCALGKCYAGAKDPKCACNADKECQAFDNNVCDGLLVCNLATNTCELDAKSIVKCDQGPCFKTTCDPQTGKCGYANLPNGAGCEADGNKCTTNDSCVAGTCIAGKAPDCDDANPCTKDTCAPSKGCVHTASTGACDDANKCTTGDSCSQKGCQPGLAKNCDDSNPCTKDTCNPKTGVCSHVGTGLNGDACDADGSVCTVKDACLNGVCVKGASLDCDDNNPCTTDACNPAGGKGCEHVANAAKCEDGNKCTTADSCKGGKCQSGAIKPCIDGDKCTTDSCAPTTGQCAFVAITGCSTKCSKDTNCQDDNACTTDVCDGGTCSNKARAGACDDGSACTTGDTCKEGLCQGAAKSCDDANACTDDQCDPKSGCVNSPAAGPCDADGSACTVGDGCKAGGCVAGGAKKCDDGKVCTIDTCNAKTGACSFDAASLDGKPCDADGSVCTHADSCKTGVCVPGKKLDCDDFNPCTADSCASASGKGSGCNHAALTGACDDGSKCTPVGKCVSGACQTPPAKTCDDDNACTTDACEAGSGACKHTKISDCAGDCVTKADCDDNKPCTKDTCALGKCQHEAQPGNCADFDKCYLAGTCQQGACIDAKKVDCDDNNECTTDKCDGAKGTCDFLGNNELCNDLNPCTLGDKCAFGKCVAGAAKGCDDSNPCTDDTCDPKSGKCSFSNNTAACDDGDKCTTNDHCGGGKCGGGTTGALSLLAGKGSTGQTDGTKDKAEFNYPRGIWADGAGNAYVAGGSNDMIRKVTASGVVSRFAGMGSAGYSNGPRLQAEFNDPQGIVGDAQGNLYVTDTGNHVIRLIDAKGLVNNFAGSGKPGMKDGYGIKAQLHQPAAITMDGAGLYITDVGTHTVQAVTLDGLVYRIAGSGKPGFKDDVGANAQFDIPMGIAAAKDGSLIVADAANHRLRKISLTGVVTTIAGGKPGKQDGPLQSASFIFPQGLHMLPTGALLIADRQNHRIRKLQNNVVSTVYGDGLIKTLYEPLELSADGHGSVWVIDSKNHRVARFTLAIKLCFDGNTCTVDSCDKKTGVCLFAPMSNGTKCGDGCFDAQICKDAKCQFGTPKNCNDYNNCTNDYCAAGVCKHVPIAGCK